MKAKDLVESNTELKKAIYDAVERMTTNGEDGYRMHHFGLNDLKIGMVGDSNISVNFSVSAIIEVK